MKREGSRNNVQLTSFRFSTNILRRLGEELNPSPSQGLIELAKNSYDADALHFVIEVTPSGKESGTVIITDDGDGMNAQEIVDGWLVLGKSEKIHKGLTRLGRQPSGDKGLGRLAALRLGSKVTLKSVAHVETGVEHRLVIDWDRYSENSLVEEVGLKITTTLNVDERLPGVQITLENLKSPINRGEIQKLARGLILLADPFNDNPSGFIPILKAPEFQDLERMVEARYFKESEFHLVADVDDQGLSRASVNDWKENQLFSANHQELRPTKKSEPYKCPKVSFDLWAFVLDADSFSLRQSRLPDVRRWLAEFGGVHLYYNGLRVAPYGDKGDDWLGLNLMRVRSPEVRPSTNTAVGRIVITDLNKSLIQKTDRSGFISNEAFQEVQQFATDALNWMAKRRLDEAEKKRAVARREAPKRSEQEKSTVQKAISVVPDEKRVLIQDAFDKYEKARQAEVNALRKEVQLYRTLSTVGIASAVFAHESAGNPLKVIGQSARNLQSRIKKACPDSYSDLFESPIERILRSTESMRVLANVTLSLVDHEKRRVGRIDVHQVISGLVALYGPFFESRDVQVSTKFAEGHPCLYGSAAAIESILSNLLSNSLISFESKPPGERRIVIRTVMVDQQLELRVLDNGPGIQGIDKSDIWLPGQTTRPNGTGLGLTIVRDTVTDLAGKVDAIEKGELGGAELVILLPVIGD
jgi:C4-dicarboxylate-specific signal transduction histidine kinase